MPNIANNFSYVPVLSLAESEQIAYQHLRAETLERILPTFELARHRDEANLDFSLDLLRSSLSERPFLLDIDKRRAPPPYVANNPSDPEADAARVARQKAAVEHYNVELSRLLRPDDGFEAWRELVSEFDNAIPILQYTNANSQELSIMRQAALLAQDGRQIGIRIRPAQHEKVCEIVARILAILPDDSQAILIFDAGTGRRNVGEKIDFVTGATDILLSGLDPNQAVTFRTVCMSSSFNSPSHDGLRFVENYDWDVWRAAAPTFPFAFGDYGGSPHRALSSFVPRNFRPTVIHAIDEGWVIFRHENLDDPNGWITGSEVVTGDAGFNPIGSWADDSILQAAGGDLSDIDRPKHWHAIRINGHIERQAQFCTTAMEDF